VTCDDQVGGRISIVPVGPPRAFYGFTEEEKSQETRAASLPFFGARAWYAASPERAGRDAGSAEAAGHQRDVAGVDGRSAVRNRDDYGSQLPNKACPNVLQWLQVTVAAG
jgi:hypothetical protein